MEVASSNNDHSLYPQILCCQCGVLMEPNAVNTCASCLASSSDITRGISTQVTLHQCKGCQRWHNSSSKKDSASASGHWMACELESRELLALCLSQVSGLRSNKNDDKHNKARLVDAAWIWTEPHSMRLKVRLTLQKQVQLGTVLQQNLVVEFIVRNQQCVECQAVFRQGSWKSLVQVRQRVSHKRTFLYLEQLILKHGAHRGCLKIETFQDGMDFYFPDKGKAARFISFLESVVPIRLNTSKKLISTDCKSNTANFKFTNMVEICPLCKDDLLHLPKDLARSLGNIARLVLVKNITNWIHLIDPLSGQTASMTEDVFWRNQENLRPLITAARSRLTRFLVLSKEAVYLRPNASKRQKHANNTNSKKTRSRLAQVTLVREDDLDVAASSSNHSQPQQHVDQISHLGYLLKAGDVCVGYNLQETQLVDDEAEELREQGKLPDVVVVRKLYGATPTTTATANQTISDANANRHRIWRLERLDVEVAESSSDNNNKRGGRGGAAKNKNDMDLDEEDFLQEVEADREMRQNINLYKSEVLLRKLQLQEKQEPSSAVAESNANNKGDIQKVDAANDTNDDGGHDDDDEDDDDQQVKLDELLDGLVLDAGPDDRLDTPHNNNNNIAEGVDDNDLMGTIEEGQRARQDGIGYVSREDARSVRDKDVPVPVVDGMGEDYLRKKQT